MTILLAKITVVQNEVALSYHRVRRLYFLAVIFAATVYDSEKVLCKRADMRMKK